METIKQTMIRNAIQSVFRISGNFSGGPHTDGCPPLPRSSKPSGVAQSKRDAVKRRNIRKNV